MAGTYFIAGVGIEIVEISNIINLLNGYSDKIHDLFTEKEIENCQGQKNTALAIKYAAKKAVKKSLGKTGLLIHLKDIEVLDDSQKNLSISIISERQFFPDKRLIINISYSLDDFNNFLVAQATTYTKRALKSRISKRPATTSSVH